MDRARVWYCSIIFLIPLLFATLKTAPAGASQELRIKPAGIVRPAVDVVLAIDDGIPDSSTGGSGNPGFGWLNILKPDTYPATIKEIQIAFHNISRGVPSGSPFKAVVYIDPEADGPSSGQRPDLLF